MSTPTNWSRQHADGLESIIETAVHQLRAAGADWFACALAAHRMRSQAQASAGPTRFDLGRGVMASLPGLRRSWGVVPAEDGEGFR